MKIYRAEDNAPVELEPLLLDDPLVANAATKVGWELLQRPDTDELGDFIGRQMAGFNNQPTASPDPQYTQAWGTREAARRAASARHSSSCSRASAPRSDGWRGEP